MGRKKLNKTYQEILAEGRIRANKYYQEHREEVKRKAMIRYNKLKNNKI